MKILAFIANGTEDSELVNTISLLKRAKIDNYLVSVEDMEVMCSHGLKVKADAKLSDLSLKALRDYDGIFIPGGSRGVNAFKNTESLLELIRMYALRAKPIMAICAGPQVLAKAGIMEGVNFTCYDTCEDEITMGIYHKEKGAIRDKNIITSRSAAYSFDFAFEIIEYLKGKEAVELVKKQILLEE